MHAGARAASSTTSARLGWLVALALAALQLARGVGTVGTRPRNAAGAFVLHVELEFKTEAAARELVTAWARCADWCRANEAGLLHYEIARSQAEPLKYGIFERYASLDAYSDDAQVDGGVQDVSPEDAGVARQRRARGEWFVVFRTRPRVRVGLVTRIEA